MAILNLEYYKDDDKYSDGDIENKILEMVQKNISYEALEVHDVEFPIIYHLSKMRENILNWYPFDSNCNILEIGSGCGAITGLLCEKGKKVTSVELSKRRATINYERHKNYENLEIIVGNFNEMVIEDKFDYIVINGVFEYAISFTESDSPYVDFLDNITRFLKKDGKILLAIENRLGLKYFAGAPEDHTELHFLGLNQYDGVNSVRTFSKNELIEILEACNLNYYDFFYPYPDYKFPKEIFTDETINSSGYGKGYPNFNENRILFFDETKVSDSLVKEKVMNVFANSFLIEASKAEYSKTSKVLYAKINSERAEEFRIITTIEQCEEKKFVVKRPLNSLSKKHIKNIKKNESLILNPKYENLPGEYKDDTLIYPFLDVKTLDWYLTQYIDKNDGESVKNAIIRFYREYFSDFILTNEYGTENFQKLFGKEKSTKEFQCVCPANIDLICDNIFISEDKRYIIDCEWIFDILIPSEFIIWRLINELYEKYKKLYKILSKQDLLKEFHIDNKDANLFLRWAIHFTYEYVKSDSIFKYSKKQLELPLMNLITDLQSERYLQSTLYYDLGSGFNEADTIKSKVVLENGKFCVEYDLSGLVNVKAFRWDPIEFKSCICTIYKIYPDDKFDIIPENAISTQDNKSFFMTFDPIYSVVIKEELPKKLLIEGDIKFLNKQDIIDYYQGELAITGENFDNLILEVEKQKKVIFELEQYNEKSNQLVQKYKTSCEDIEYRLKSKMNELNRITNSYNEIADSYNEIVDSYNEISNSFSWKITRPIRFSLDMMKKIKRKLIKDVKNKQTINTTLNELKEEKKVNLYYNIDKFKYENHIINITGWIFADNLQLTDKRIGFYNNNKRYGFTKLHMIDRDDVVQSFQTSHAEKCGFDFYANIYSPINLDVVLEYKYEHNWTQIIIGEIDGDSNIEGEPKFFVSAAQRGFDNIVDIKSQYVNEDFKIPQYIYNETVDVIVPIYNGYEYFEKLFSTIPLTKMEYRLILINDNSPDKRVSEFLHTYEQEHPNTILIQNKENYGFVKSANKGFSITVNHVALINSDIELPKFWLERLMLPILLDGKVASSTPFTNCGTIFSFPDFGKDNNLFENLDLDIIDNQFKQIIPDYTEVPTGVGFCMGINKVALKEIGFFDEETFSKGYGEENDWCQRAIKGGYKNVHVENLFVYHKHGGSFLSQEKADLIEKNSKELDKKHPNYFKDTALYCEMDPIKSIREYVILQLINKISVQKTIVAFDHNIGGGATSYLENRKKIEIEKNNKFIIIRYDIYENRYLINISYKEYTVTYMSLELDDILKLLNDISIEQIWINELVSYPEIYQLFNTIIQLKNSKNAKLIMLIHDFYAICPAISLFDDKETYCGVPDAIRCEECLKTNKYTFYPNYQSADKWRSRWHDFIKECDDIIVFSNNSLELLQKSYGQLDSVKVIPHKVANILAVNKSTKTTKTLNIGLLGVLSKRKGLDIVRDMLNVIDEDNLPIKIKLIGTCEEEIEDNNITTLGKYTREMLPRLIYENDVDIILIPSIIPETFSYTTEEAIKMGIPVAVFNIGAPAERVSKYDKGLILSEMKGRTVIKETSDFMQSKLLSELDKIIDRKVLFIAEYISFSSRYRVDHLREQLYLSGISSDYIKLSDAKDINYEVYASIVVYRCSDVSAIRKLCEKARENKVSVFYDIDDFIFEYEKINNLEFLKDDEYIGFEKYSQDIKNSMELCDGFITSTNSMEKAIKMSFSKKPIMVNRNVVSMEMIMLSLDAIAHSKKTKDEIVLGYFSGSKTHDSDFEIISETLFNILDKYSNVYLKLGGFIKKNGKFNRYKDRIRFAEFVDWRYLPEQIASIDINLMPLENTFFHTCKSENKWTEAALVNVPTIASYNNELSGVIENWKTGVLCKNQEEWEFAIDRLISDKELRNKIAENATNEVMQNHTTRKISDDIIKFIIKD